MQQYQDQVQNQSKNNLSSAVPSSFWETELVKTQVLMINDNYDSVVKGVRLHEWSSIHLSEHRTTESFDTMPLATESGVVGLCQRYSKFKLINKTPHVQPFIIDEAIRYLVTQEQQIQSKSNRESVLNRNSYQSSKKSSKSKQLIGKRQSQHDLGSSQIQMNKNIVSSEVLGNKNVFKGANIARKCATNMQQIRREATLNIIETRTQSEAEAIKQNYMNLYIPEVILGNEEAKQKQIIEKKRELKALRRKVQLSKIDKNKELVIEVLDESEEEEKTDNYE
eukprot:403369700